MCLWGVFVVLPVAAQHQLDSVFVLVKLQDDGSARVTERRDARMSDQGTEGFITFNNMGDIGVTDIKVMDDELDSAYVVEEEWDVDRSRAAKTGRCGYHRTSEGVELCWGIGRAGNRSYYISYTLTNLVKSYDDYDGFCHSFYEAANSPASFAMVTICVPGDTLSKKDARIWTFGYDGWKGIGSYFVWARTEGPMRNGDSMIALVELEKGLLHPTVKKEGTFKELVKRPAFVDSEYDIDVAMGDTLYTGATRSSLMGGEVGSGHEGSSHYKPAEEDEGGWQWGLIGTFLLIMGLIGWAAKGPIQSDLALKKYNRKRFAKLTEMLDGKKWDEYPYWRELPMEGNLLGSSAVLAAVLNIHQLAGHSIKGISFSVQHLYEAFILRMFYRGGITLDYDTDKHGKTRHLFRIAEPMKPEKRPALDVTKKATCASYISGSRRRLSEDLYGGLMRDVGIQYMLQDLLYRASGIDHLLQPEELRIYVNQHLEQLRPMADALYRVAESRLEDSALKAEEVKEVVGFVRYLQDFSLVSERHIEEVNLWKEYLVYASFYGIADQVRSDMRKVAPDVTKLDQLIPPHVLQDFKPIATALATSLYSAHQYETSYEREKRRASYSSSSDRSPRSYSSSSGGSGRSSYSGGGGHSGGGGSGFR